MTKSEAETVAEAEGDGHDASKYLKSEYLEIVKLADKTNGINSADVPALRLEHGTNELDDGKKNKVLLFLSFFWGPMPIMIWAAILIELIQGVLTGATWIDFGVLLALQFANGIVGFVEENNAGDAIQKLKQQLAPSTHVCRDGVWQEIKAKELLPGDLIEMKLGDIIPADCVLLEGQPVQVDQAALTGESLPVTAGPGALVFMSSALKQGHIKAIVVATGRKSFMGTSANLMASVQHQGRLHKILLQITVVLLILCILLCAAIFAKLMTAEEPEGALHDGAGSSKFMRSLSVVVVILVASIPVAIEVVVTSTMAVGSHMMARHKVIVARLSAIEELAGMTVLCSDKTGTLTLNQLQLRDPILIAAKSREEALLYSALSSKRVGNIDAIDKVISEAVATLPAEMQTHLNGHVELEVIPFDPVSKRTVATVRQPDGAIIKVAKGAPQVILRMSQNANQIKDLVDTHVNELASRGFRALGVGVCRNPNDEQPIWEYLAVLSLFDPPRPDTKSTILAAIDNGVEVKMITGDQTAIAKETCRQLGMGTNILRTDALDVDLAIRDPVERAARQAAVDHVIMEAHGFAEVMPEHKFRIVERIQKQGHVTGMTGDGVNDAPALKRADIGIAVHGATDAAKAAAAIVITEPGLSVIIEAIRQSRQIFQRMRNYIIYRVSCTMQLLLFFFFGIICINADTDHMYGGVYPSGTPNDMDKLHAPHFTLPVISLVIITILNDGCMITISHDKVKANRSPQTWDMFEVWVISVVLGLVACLSSLILLAEGMHANYLHPGTVVGKLWGSSGRDYLLWTELKTILYLKISISDFLTLFSARSRSWFWERCLGTSLGIAFVIATAVSTLFALFWEDFIDLEEAKMSSLRHSNGAVISTWIYCILWMLVQDAIKVGTYALLDRLRPDEEKEKLEFAKDHSAASLQRIGTKPALDLATQAIVARAEATAAKVAAGPVLEGTLSATIGRATGGRTIGSAGTRSTISRAESKRLPDGVDLNQVLRTAQYTLTQRTRGAGVGVHRGVKDIFGARVPIDENITSAPVQPPLSEHEVAIQVAPPTIDEAPKE